MENNTEDDNETRKLQPSYAMAVSSLSPSTVIDISGTNYLAESELVQNLLHGAYMNGFDLFDFLESLQPSDCLQVCLDEVASMLEQPFAGQRSVDEVGNICSHFDIFQRCLHHNTTCKDALLDVTTTVIDHLCTFNKDAFGDMFPCLYGHSAVIYFTCDNQCRMGKILSKASKEKKGDVAKILDDDGNNLLEILNFYDLCSASTCFINCTQNMAEKECSIGHSTLLHKIVAAVVNHTIKMIPNSEMKSSDAYTLLVSSILPNECQRLKPLPQDVTLTTPMADFTNDVEYGSDKSVMQQKTVNSAEIQATLNTNSAYVQILPLNGRQMKLQCQMIDLETGQESTVADIATLMTTAARASYGSKISSMNLAYEV
uniref:CPG4 domain-containing protein n=1 Tax=Loa loa TaxID=7209 RepID=A0A1I7W0R6_LOALO